MVHLLTCTDLFKFWSLGYNLISDFAHYFTSQDKDFVWTSTKISQLTNLILSASDDPLRIREWKRKKWLTGLIPDSDIKTLTKCLSSSPKAYNFAISITRLFRSFFYDVIWTYRNEKMKVKEETLHINVKTMALQKKKSRLRKNISGLPNNRIPLDHRRGFQLFLPNISEISGRNIIDILGTNTWHIIQISGI